jgi:hypothetical protein
MQKYSKTRRHKHHARQFLPIWTQANTNAVNLVVRDLLQRWGITDASTYFQKLRYVIAISVIVFAFIGATAYGLTGLVLGILSGLLAPIAAIWLSILLLGISIFLGLYVLAWAAVWVIAKWVLSEVGKSFGGQRGIRQDRLFYQLTRNNPKPLA